jgi:hypothetical protein
VSGNEIEARHSSPLTKPRPRVDGQGTGELRRAGEPANDRVHLDQILLLDEAADDHQHLDWAEIAEIFRPHFHILGDVLTASDIRRRFDEVFSTQRGAELYIAFEHVALTGGLLLAAIASPL